MDEEPLLAVEDLTKHYPTDSGVFAELLGWQDHIKAVTGVDFAVTPGEVFGIVGESGSGKSTLGETILRLEEPTAGRIYFDGEDVTNFSKSDLRAFRKNAQIIFQDPYESLNPTKTVYQAIKEPLDNFYDLSRDETRERIESILFDVGLRPPEQFFDLIPSQMSGGQVQRVNIARGVVLDPELLIADEPLSMLDVSIQSGILKMLDEIKEKYDLSVIYISHDISVVRLISDRIAVMYRGEIVEMGETERVIEAPKHPYTRALISSVPRVDQKRNRTILPPDPFEETERPDCCSFHPRCPDVMDVCQGSRPALAEVGDSSVKCFLHHDEVEDR